jgi:hypothetical protein
MAMQAMTGYFLPDATILCARCLPASSRYSGWAGGKESEALVLAPFGSIHCDGCGRNTCTGRQDVQMLGQVRDQLMADGIDSCLEQTGGMCVALEILIDRGTTLRVYADDDGGLAVCTAHDCENSGEVQYDTLADDLDVAGAMARIKSYLVEVRA